VASAGHVQVCTSLQTDNHTSTSPLSFFTGRMPFLPPNQQRQSTEGTSTEGTSVYQAAKAKLVAAPLRVAGGNCRPGGKYWQPTAGFMTQHHLQADC